MLGDRPAYGSIFVDDAASARKFYEGQLGLSIADTDQTGENGVLVLHLAGGHRVHLTPRSDHVPSRYAVLTFLVADLEAAVDELGGRGVEFLHYEEFGQKRAGVVHALRGAQVAWFCDPAGNVLSLRREQ